LNGVTVPQRNNASTYRFSLGIILVGYLFNAYAYLLI
jgi:hypothetical protein